MTECLLHGTLGRFRRLNGLVVTMRHNNNPLRHVLLATINVSVVTASFPPRAQKMAAVEASFEGLSAQSRVTFDWACFILRHHHQSRDCSSSDVEWVEELCCGADRGDAPRSGDDHRPPTQLNKANNRPSSTFRIPHSQQWVRQPARPLISTAARRLVFPHVCRPACEGQWRRNTACPAAISVNIEAVSRLDLND